MKKLTHKPLAGALVALLLAWASGGTAWAQSTTPTDSAHNPDTMGAMHSGQGMMSGMHMKNMMGMHAMPATVSSVDTKTGIVDVNAEGMTLKVHFPPPAVANLKAGDKITLHMGYSKP
jgi:hypothetical protein